MPLYLNLIDEGVLMEHTCVYTLYINAELTFRFFSQRKLLQHNYYTQGRLKLSLAPGHIRFSGIFWKVKKAQKY